MSSNFTFEEAQSPDVFSFEEARQPESFSFEDVQPPVADLSKLKLSPYEQADIASMESGLGKAPTGMEPGIELTASLGQAAGEAATQAGQVLTWPGRFAYASAADLFASGLTQPEYGGNIHALLAGKQLPAEKFIAGTAQYAPNLATAANVGVGLTEMAPAGALGALPAWANRLLAAGFSIQMIKDAPEESNQLGEEMGKPADQQDAGKIASLKSSLIQKGIFAPLAGAHAITGGIIPQQRPPIDFETMKRAQVPGIKLTAPGEEAPPLTAPLELPPPTPLAPTGETVKPKAPLAPPLAPEVKPPEPTVEAPAVPTDISFLDKPMGSHGPEVIAAIPDDVWGEAMRKPKGEKWSMTADATAWAMTQTSTPELIAKLDAMSKADFDKAMAAGEFPQKAQWFMDAIHALKGDEVGLSNMARVKQMATDGRINIVPPAVAPAPAPAPPTAPATNEIRDLIGQEVSGIQKAANIKKLANKNGITVKEMQERIEAEIVKMGHENSLAMQKAGQGNDRYNFNYALALYENQPVMSGRTSSSVEAQAYSTPLPLSIALNHALNVTPRDPIYDSTAGNGMLLIGGNLQASHGNELQKSRADALRGLKVGTVTEHDATKFVPTQKFPVVKVNPPFGSIDNVNYGGYGIKKLEHLISLKALEAMSPNGRAALILGAKMQPGESTAHGAQWVFENYLYGHYNVVGNFEVAGDLYSKQGASWPVRVIVIDGKKAQPIGGVLAPEHVDRLDTWDDVWKESDRIRNEIDRRRQTLGTPRPSGVPLPPPGPTAAPGQRPAAPRPAGPITPAPLAPIRPAGEGTGQPQAPQQPRSGGTGRPPIRPVSKPEDEPPTVRQPSPPQQPPAPVGGGLRVPVEAPAHAPAGGPPGSAGVGPRIVPKPPTVAGTEHQNPYVPRSQGNPFGTLSPKGVVTGTEGALDALQKRVGPVDEFVANRLNMTVDEIRSVMAAEQIDGVALAIDQIETGGAVIIGDETGIGKGRQGAALIRYAKLNGKIPVFFTKDPKLFTDMYGDLQDIHTTITPLIFGDPVKASIVDAEGNVIHRSPGGARQRAEMARIDEVGWDKSGYDAIFATYSQVNKRNAQQQFLEVLADENDTILILDEAHEAAGDAKTSMQAAFMSGGVVIKGSGPDQTKTAVPGLLRTVGTKAGRGGVLYMSATYAKRPDNMPVYFRTSLNKAADSFGQIVDAMKRGGVALQQAVSESLAKVGQYIRRERDFNGVSYNMKQVTPANAAELVDQVDQVTDVLSEIVSFSGKIRDAVVGDESSTVQSEDAISMTDFASIVHNQVGQLLLAAKADAIVEECLAAKAAGEKPVIAVMNTMESFLDHYVDDKGIKVGQPLQLRWNELLKHALERTLRTTRDNPDGSTTIGQADPYAVGLGELYDSIKAAADSIETKFPISPIDYILQKLNASGVKMLELTGRQSGIIYINFETGESTYAKFKKANKNTVVNQFNSGAADGMLMNSSGSTGLSAHASEKFKDQRPRHMIIGQPALDINTFVQTLGRIKRTGMVLRGKDAKGQPYGAKYTHLVLPLQAEIRPAAIAAKKMKSLNANTTAEADAAIKIQSEDIMNKYGDLIVAEFLDEHPEIQFATGISIGHKEDGGVEVPPDLARKFTGRMAIRPNSEQAAIYSAIIPAYNDLIEQLKATGDYDLEVAVHDDWDAKLISSDELVPGTDEGNIFTAGVRVQKWEIKDPRHVPTGEEMREDFEKRTGGKDRLMGKWRDYQEHADTVFEDARVKFNEPLEKPTPMGELGRQNLIDSLASKKERWENTRDLVHHVIRQAGEVVELSNTRTGESYNAVLVDAKLPKMGEASAKGFSSLRVAPSAFRFRFAIDAPGGVIYLHAGSFIDSLEGSWNVDSSSLDFSDLTGKKPNARYERTFLVGNPIRGYDATGGVGKVARFTTQDGTVVTGLMMPRNWDMGKLSKDPRLDLVSGPAAAWFLREHSGYYGETQIETAGGVVRIGKTYGTQDSYTISTPSARRTGGMVYLDPGLLRITGDFTKVGNKMRADIDTGQLPKVIETIMGITKGRFRPAGRVTDAIGKVAEANRRAKSAGPGGELYSGIPIPGIVHAVEYTFRDLWERIPGWAMQVRNGWRSFTMQALPRITASNRPAGESGARSAVAPMVGRTKGLIFASKVTEGIKVPDFDLKLGTGLNEDNLRDIKRKYNDMADEAENREELIDDLREQIAELTEQAEEGDTGARREIRKMQKEIARLSALTDRDVVIFRDKANAVVTMIGAEDSPFATEAEYHEFMDSAEAQDAIDRHVALWETDKDPIYRESIDLDPEAPLETRGLEYGARVNLKAVLPDQETKTTIKPSQKGQFVKSTATLKKSNPHRIQAKGTGNYEGSYQEIMASGFEYEYTVAKQHEFIRKLLAAGDARVTPKKFAAGLELKGERTVGYPLRFTPWRNQYLQVRQSLAKEYEDATGIASLPTLGLYTTAANVMTRLSVQGLAEGSTHASNLLLGVFTGLGPTGNPFLNSLLKSLGRSDLFISLPSVIVKAFGDRREEMLKLAEIGATKEPYRGTVGWALTKLDQGVRLYSAGVYKAMSANGYLPKTETGLREFVSRVGQYTKALQPRWIQLLRSTQIQPFATAMQNFNVQGLRTIVASPGVKASSNAASAALRMEMIAGIIGFVVVLKILQLLLTKSTEPPPGTRLGAVGWIGDDGKLHQFDLGLLTGYTRGLRITGLQGFIEGKRLGLDTGAALTAGVGSAFNTGLSTAAGPMNRFLTVGATGYRPSFPPVREAPVVPPQNDEQLNLLKTQSAQNLLTAVQESSPLLDFAVRGPYQQKYWEALQRQFSRYTPKTGMSPETIEKLPEIVQAGELKNYVEALAKEARKLPRGSERNEFISERLAADGVEGKMRTRTMQELKRHGVYSH